MSAQHAGPPVIKPAGYRGAHAAPRCPMIAAVSIPDSSRVTLLVCDLAAHDAGLHYDETDLIWWESSKAAAPSATEQTA